uniref:Cytochrome-c oxidase n=1 Tax=Ditylenchus dipsaci TaxID=166011 RepID=A0A915CZX2_9BILA
MGNIMTGAYVTGYLTYVGAVFCTHPTLIYLFGAIGVSSWCSASMTCCLLAFNRCVDFTRADLFNQMFAGKKTYIWLLLPISYFSLIFFFEMPLMFNSNYVTWFYDPFVGIPVHYNLDMGNIMTGAYVTGYLTYVGRRFLHSSHTNIFVWSDWSFQLVFSFHDLFFTSFQQMR